MIKVLDAIAIISFIIGIVGGVCFNSYRINNLNNKIIAMEQRLDETSSLLKHHLLKGK